MKNKLFVSILLLASVSHAYIVPGPSVPTPPPYVDPNPPGQYDPYQPQPRPEPVYPEVYFEWKDNGFGSYICVEVSPWNPEGSIVDDDYCE